VKNILKDITKISLSLVFTIFLFSCSQEEKIICIENSKLIENKAVGLDKVQHSLTLNKQGIDFLKQADVAKVIFEYDGVTEDQSNLKVKFINNTKAIVYHSTALFHPPPFLETDEESKKVEESIKSRIESLNEKSKITLILENGESLALSKCGI
jgi:hypothetical protein